MERSMIQQLTNSQMFMNRSFITTATHTSDEPYDLKKSRIYNLPNYKKEDMSSKQSFIIVFQAIEIQRLSLEVDTLRVKLKDADRHIFNAGNYEVQIRELTDKCVSYEREREEYRQELQKMNMICQRLYDELEEMKRRYAQVDLTLKEKYRLEQTRNQELQQQVDKWKTRFSSMELSKNKEIQDIKLMVQSQRKSMIDREIRELTIKFETERNGFQHQVRKLRGSLQNKNTQLTRVQSQLSRLSMQIRQLQQNQDKMNQYQNKVVMLSQQMMRLNQMLRSKQEQIDRLRSSQSNMKASLIQSEKVNDDYNKVLGRQKELKNQIMSINTQYSRLEQENRRNSLVANKVGEFQRLLDDSASEIQRLNHIVRDKIHEVEQRKQDYSLLQSQYKDIKNNQEKIPELEQRINNLIVQNDRINGILKSRTAEVQDWKNKNSNLQKTIINYSLIQKQNVDLKNATNRYINDLEQKNSQIRKLKDIAQSINALQQRILKQQQKSWQLNKQIDRLNNLVKGKTTQCQSLAKAIHQRETQLQNLRELQAQLKQHRRREAVITQQLDRINGLILQRTQEIAKFKQQFSKMNMNVNEFKRVEIELLKNMGQVKDLVMKLDQSRKESQFFQEKMIIAESQIRKLEAELFNVSKEKSSLGAILQQKDRQLEQLTMELRQRDAEVRGLRQTELKIREIQIQYQELQKNFKAQRNRSQSLQQEVNRMKNQGVFSQEFRIEYTKSRKQCEQTELELRNIQSRLQNVQRILKGFRIAMQNQLNLNKSNQNKWSSVGTSLNNLTEFIKRMVSMHHQVTRLAQQNINLESSARIMNFQLENSAAMSKSLVVPQLDHTPNRNYNQNHSLNNNSFQRRQFETVKKYNF